MNEIRKIYLIRHCEPQLPEGIPICIGKKDIPLSDFGRKQALDLKEFFSKINISSIYSSPLIRSKETAIIIANEKRNVIVKKDFSEFNIGKWDGMSFGEIKEKYPQEYKDRGENLEHYIVEGGESMAMCRDRALTELMDTIKESIGDIIIAAHAGVNRAILSSILGISIRDSFKYRHEYGSINLLLFDGENLKVDKIGTKLHELIDEAKEAEGQNA
mgnify:CR=1 FL=1|jgi:probable phosphoglycerate mutase